MKKSRIKNKNPTTSSKTLLFILIIFAVAVSFLFMKGLALGENDAVTRTSHINYVATLIGIDPVKTDLLENLFRWLMVGPMIIIAIWVAVLLRGMMECGCPRILIIIAATISLPIGAIWIPGYILSLIPIGKYLSYLILHGLGITLIVVVWFLILFSIGAIYAIKQHLHGNYNPTENSKPKKSNR